MRYFLFLLGFPLACMGQMNLVPNSDFESMSQCPPSLAWLSVCDDWENPNQASPDYYHSCCQPSGLTNEICGMPYNAFGDQHAASGNAYVGVYCFYLVQPQLREYIQVELTNPLEQGKSYLVSFYTSVGDNGLYGISTMGAYLSVDAITSNDVYRFDVVPQVLNDAGPLIDSTAWMLVSDTFVSPLGGERYLTIGNFNTDATSDTVRYNPTGDVSYVYAYYYIDDVSVVELDGPVGIAAPNLPKREEFGVYPNPNNGEMTLEYHLNETETGHITIYNSLGQTVLTQALDKGTIKMTIRLNGIGSGLYSVLVIKNGQLVLSEKVSILE